MISTLKKVLPPGVRRLIRKVASSPPRSQMEEFLRTGRRFRPRLSDFPPMVMVDTTTRCNLACSHCPNSILAEDTSWLGDMETDLYRKIVDEIADEKPDTLLRPFDGGEPLMRRDLGELIGYAKVKGIRRVSINTNGLLMNQKRAEELIHAGLDDVEFSIDGFSAETYERIRGSKHYDRLMGNIAEFLRLRSEHRPSLTVTVSFVSQPDNKHEEEMFTRHWSELVNRVDIRPLHEHGGLVSITGKKAEFSGDRWPCPYLWDRIIVNHDGKVRFCEFDWRGDHALGDVRLQSLKEIWNSVDYRRLREQHIAGTFEHPYCQACTDWPSVSW
jgi:radical SAM protein with 4Fe4S-binding SPASM domain